MKIYRNISSENEKRLLQNGFLVFRKPKVWSKEKESIFSQSCFDNNKLQELIIDFCLNANATTWKCLKEQPFENVDDIIFQELCDIYTEICNIFTLNNLVFCSCWTSKDDISIKTKVAGNTLVQLSMNINWIEKDNNFEIVLQEDENENSTKHHNILHGYAAKYKKLSTGSLSEAFNISDRKLSSLLYFLSKDFAFQK